MQYDLQLTLATANTRFGPWQNQQFSLAELYQRLAAPARGTETRAAYLAMPKRDQDRLKDVGGFVGGPLTDGVRKNGHVAGRQLITLDLDKIAKGGTETVLARVEALGCGYAVYSTRKHCADAPRLRVLLPLSAPVDTEAYEPLARAVAHRIDPSMQVFDRTTFEPARLMYWPSCCADGEYVFRYADRPALDGAAALAQLLPDWRNIATWPRCADEGPAVAHAAQKQADPTTKEGVIGAFCRVYDVPAVIDTYLSGVYAPCDGTEGRYTYAAGSTAGGAVLYENGKFLYSFHSTDPASGQLCNAFDLVRLHRFGELDDTSRPGTPVGRLPSYKAMCKLASSDPAVAAQLDADGQERAIKDFSFVTPTEPVQGLSGASAGTQTENRSATAEENERNGQKAKIRFKITRLDNGKPELTIDNAWALLETDPLLKGRIVVDDFRGRGVAIGPYPWNDDPKPREWTDSDDAGVQWYLERTYGYGHKQNIITALTLCGNYHSFNPVQDYLNGLQWDGVPRLDTLFVDYLGAEDNDYTRAVTRKALVAAVARAFQPGIKFDNMTILTGPTGIGKSTILKKLGKSWFSDSLQSFEGKDSRELIQGCWIIEVGELGYMSRTETNQVKQFLSQQDDQFRAAYGRRTESHPRHCVFFGTSNDYDYLRDRTGNRRFWPVDVGVTDHARTPFTMLDTEVDQIWAEAVVRYRIGEPLYITGNVEKAAYQVQKDHMEQDSITGMVLKYLDDPVPENWNKMDATERRVWMSGVGPQTEDDPDLVLKDRVCAADVMQDALGWNPTRAKSSEIRTVNAIIKDTKEWEAFVFTSPIYGRVRGWRRSQKCVKRHKPD